jgi:hypothetical protein
VKLIFLDIDGVLNWIGTEDRISGFIGLDPTRIAQFNKIIDAVPDAKIVVSSTWRKTGMFGVYEDFNGLKKLLADRGLRGEIIGHTPIHFGRRGRGQEIREYLDEEFQVENPGQTVDSFVILDDDTTAMEGWKAESYLGKDEAGDDEYEAREGRDLRPFHVRTFWDGEQHLIGGDTVTNVEGGLQDYHVEDAIKILRAL